MYAKKDEDRFQCAYQVHQTDMAAKTRVPNAICVCVCQGRINLSTSTLAIFTSFCHAKLFDDILGFVLVAIIHNVRFAQRKRVHNKRDNTLHMHVYAPHI